MLGISPNILVAVINVNRLNCQLKEKDGEIW